MNIARKAACAVALVSVLLAGCNDPNNPFNPTDVCFADMEGDGCGVPGETQSCGTAYFTANNALDTNDAIYNPEECSDQLPDARVPTDDGDNGTDPNQPPSHNPYAYEGDDPGECSDGADNDANGNFDCDDSGCYGSPDCEGEDTPMPQPEPEVCDDHTDNDFDGLFDCADSDCIDEPECQPDEPEPPLGDPEVCDDEIDNDLDGQFDCWDPDCFTAFECQPEEPPMGDDDDDVDPEDCEDGLDNDLDGFADCDDADCFGTLACIEQDCADGIDNDIDGFVDCSDIDCAPDPSCAPPPPVTPDFREICWDSTLFQGQQTLMVDETASQSFPTASMGWYPSPAPDLCVWVDVNQGVPGTVHLTGRFIEASSPANTWLCANNPTMAPVWGEAFWAIVGNFTVDGVPVVWQTDWTIPLVPGQIGAVVNGAGGCIGELKVLPSAP